MFSSEYVDKVKKANKIQDIIREDGVILSPNGNDFEGFHSNIHDSNSGKSLKVTVDKQLYKCFGCGEGGNIIEWLQINRNMSYNEAVMYLAERAGMALPNISPEDMEKYNTLKVERVDIRRVFSRFATICNEELTSELYNLLESKWGLKKETVDNLKIGYVPVNFQYTFNKLINEGFSEEIIFKSGLVKDDKYKTDTFVGRIIIPYFSSGHVAYFAGRETYHTPKIVDKTNSKYKKLPIHSEKNPHISKTIKNDHLYGEDNIKGKKDILITEGLFDCVSAIQAGFFAISIGTVNLSKEVEPKIISLVKGKNVTIIFDSELTGTGEREALKLATILEENGINVKIVILPRLDVFDKIDLADYLNSNNPEELRTLICTASTAFDIYIDKLEQNREDKEIRNKIIEIISKKDNMVQDECKKKLCVALKPLGIGMKAINESVKESKKKQNKNIDNSKNGKKSATINMDNIYELLFDERKIPYAVVAMHKRKRLVSLASQQFKNWLVYQRLLDGEETSDSQLSVIINTLSAKCWNADRHYKFDLRIAGHDESFFYDLANSNDDIIKISSGKWEILNSENIEAYFYRYSNTVPQVTPNPAGDIRRLLYFVNIKDKKLQLLYLVCIVSYLIPRIPHPVIVVHGTQGASKSTFSKVSRSIVDPALAPTFRGYNDKQEFFQYFSHNHVVILDNLSSINQELSDMLCSACTGDGTSKRMLYTNDDDVIFTYMRCIIINGINCTAVKPDLLRRSLLFKLESIPASERKEEKNLWVEFENEKSYIFGGILNTLAKAMELYPSVKLTECTSMADFTRWGCAIAQALGYSTDEFLDAYEENMRMQNEEALNSNEVAELIFTLISQRKKWEGTADELLSELNNMAENRKISTRVKTWPQTPNNLSRQINVLIPTLESFGVIVDKVRNKSSRKIILKMKEETSELPDIKDSKNLDGDDSGGTVDFIDILSSPNKSPKSFGITTLFDDDDIFSSFGSSNSEPVGGLDMDSV